MDEQYAKSLLDKTKGDYNLIAEDFSRTRDYLPENIMFLEKYAQNGEKILDLGCGNGRLIELFLNKNVEYTGVDVSGKFIEISQKRYPQGKFIVAPALNLPFPDNYFDAVYSLAVFHHIPSEDFRNQFLKEIKRVLAPNGILILSVWNLWHLWFRPDLWFFRKRLRKYFKLIIKYTAFNLLKRSQLDFKDIFISWQNNTMRYVHCFSRGELESLLRKNGFSVKEIFSSGNRKTKESGIYLIAKNNY